MKKKEKNNYIKLIIIILIAVILTIIIGNLYRSVNSNSDTSYLAKHVSTINYKELSSTITELNSNSFIYLSYTGDNNINDFEKKLRKIIKQYGIEDNFIYVDCTNEIDENHTISSLKNILIAHNKEIVLPTIIYFRDNEPIDYIDSTDNLLRASDFNQLLDKYELERK